MKSIGNIYLSWRKDADSPRILVGIIKRNTSDGVRFIYLADGVLEAIPLGFKPYRGFPDPIDVYRTNVLRIFGHRILQAAAPDIEAYFDFWDINRTFKSKPYYMLAYTQGMLPDDHFEFLADFNPKKDFSLVTDICQLKNADKLSEGDELRYVLEADQTEDKYAVKLYKGHTDVGAVKVIHNRIFSKTRNLKVRVYKIEQERVFLRISMGER